MNKWIWEVYIKTTHKYILTFVWNTVGKIHVSKLIFQNYTLRGLSDYVGNLLGRVESRGIKDFFFCKWKRDPIHHIFKGIN